MLHMDVFRQRLMEEHSIDVIITNPSVAYLCNLRGKGGGDLEDDSSLLRIENPAEAPKPELIQAWKEAICRATIITPRDYYKGIKALCEERRAICLSEEFAVGGKSVQLVYDIPTTEMVTNFFDMLKSLSQGYASLDYEHDRFQVSDIKKVMFHLNGDPVDALSFLVHDSRILGFSRSYAKRLKEILPAQLFQVAI